MANRNIKSLIGERFTRLTVVQFIGYDANGRRLWLCSCECGNTKKANTRALTSKHTKSCGCLPTSVIKHGGTNTLLYFIWRSIRRRANPKFANEYPDYSGRGIKMCERWKEFANFRMDMGAGYQKGLSVERIDNNGDYCPENCKWATYKEQNRNKRNNVFFEIDGQTKCLSDWCVTYNISITTVGHRLKLGWDLITALTSPVEARYKNNFNGNVPVKKIRKTTLALHTQIGYFCTIAEAANMYGYSQGYMSEMLSGKYKNKTSFIKV